MLRNVDDTFGSSFAHRPAGTATPPARTPSAVSDDATCGDVQVCIPQSDRHWRDDNTTHSVHVDILAARESGYDGPCAA